MKYYISLLFAFFSLISFSQGTTSFIGIGVKLQIDSTSLLFASAAKIIDFTPDGSAIHSGLEVGDLITKVDDQDATNIPLADVIKMIVGEEGTEVTIEVTRNFVPETYTLTRKRIANATTFKATTEDSDFCSAVTKILNDGSYRFENIIDTTTQVGEGYACTVKVPDVEQVMIKQFLSRSCYITIGKYTTEDEANTSGETVLNNLKNCFPTYYYHPFTDNGTKTIQIGFKLDNGGYSSAMMVFYSYFDTDDNKFHVELRIDEGGVMAFFPILTETHESNFATAIRKIYDDVKYDFNNIKGTEHETGGPFNMGYWYDLNMAVPAAASAYIDAGSLMSMAPKQCIAQFFLGEKELSTETYTKLGQIVYDALGSEFVYCYDKPEELMTEVIPKTAESVMIFAIKRERVGESIPVVALINQRQEDGRYLIYMNFYKTVY